MGVTYFVANTTKRQYFDPGIVGGPENTKRSGILRGLSGHALAQLLLPACRLEFHLEPWIGDALVLVGDESEPNSIGILAPFQDAPDLSSYQIVTTKFDDISLNLLALLCKRADLRNEFVDHAEHHRDGLVSLAHAVVYLGARHIELALIQRFGAQWRDVYHDALKTQPWHFSLPMTPATRKSMTSHET